MSITLDHLYKLKENFMSSSFNAHEAIPKFIKIIFHFCK